MAEDAYELTTEDLIEEEAAPPPKKLPVSAQRTAVSVTGASKATPPPPPGKPRFVPTVRAGPIKERSRTPAPEKVEEGGGLASKAASFYEQAIEAEKAGDARAAIRHVKLAITFDPKDPRYHALLSRLARE